MILSYGPMTRAERALLVPIQTCTICMASWTTAASSVSRGIITWVLHFTFT